MHNNNTVAQFSQLVKCFMHKMHIFLNLLKIESKAAISLPRAKAMRFNY